ncbi:hypothetical protein [Ligilactobacillus equi]|uniref:Uncharacterized protein n=1 Tax=Ligilactobacillus equi DSM 15833 = JCM 10991 TaxID=1423740 RepID=A0A0R1TEL2_9LACO|nr:hypothetical protein [Ligilactobacillus equi]KRL79513.1 hypothetical protein FC36_GL000461 [Ligilactobacillus equi DSM 15833 = JCM 10991]
MNDDFKLIAADKGARWAICTTPESLTLGKKVYNLLKNRKQNAILSTGNLTGSLKPGFIIDLKIIAEENNNEKMEISLTKFLEKHRDYLKEDE